MPAVRTQMTSRVHAVTTRQILKQARDRPMRFTRRAFSLGYRSEDFDPPSPASSPAPSTDTPCGSVLSKSPPTTPPTTSPTSDTTPMSISDIFGTQPSTPETPTPISNGTRGFANRRGLVRTYSMILSPGDVPMHPLVSTPATPASSPESTDSEDTPQGSPQAAAGMWILLKP